jgi:creatinine amidohydrolase
MATLFAEELTAPEFRDFVTERTVGILPVAAIEPHGPHLPLSTDCDIARGHLSRLPELADDEIDMLVLPLQTVGHSLEHTGLAGTFTHSAEHLLQGWADIVRSFHAANGRRLILVSSHGGNSEVAGLLVQRLRAELGMLAVTASWQRFGQPEDLFTSAELDYGVHGGAVETSLMLHYWPELVRRDFLADFGSAAESWDESARQMRAHGRVRYGWMSHDLNPDGAVGNATLASAEKGAASAEHALNGFMELVEDVAAFDLARFARVSAT